MSRRYNILQYIETCGPGGAETVLLNIAKNVDKNKFNLKVVLPKSDWLAEQLLKNNIDTEIIPSKRSWDMSFRISLIRYCRRNKTDLIHSHLFGSNLYSCLAGMILRLPVIATFHNELYFLGRKEKFMPVKSAILRNFATRMVFVAEYMKKDYVEHLKFPENKLATIYNGIELDYKIDDFDTSSFKKEINIRDDDLVVGHIANLREPKGHRYLVKAASIVSGRFPNVKFLLIGDEGDGSIKKEIEILIAEAGLEKNVKLLGFRSDVNKLLKILDIFVLPSTTEGMPLSVIEAIAASKPIVATNVGGLPEIIEPGHTGFLVEPKNVEQLADKIILLLGDEALRNRISKTGRKIVEKKYALKPMIDSYQDLYNRLIK